MEKRTYLKSVIPMLLAALLLFGCVEAGQSPVATTAANAQTTAATQAQTEAALPEGQLTATPVTLTYWVGLSANAAASINSYNENEMYKYLEERTNVKIDFLHPTMGQESEQFNLMIASRDLPDIVEYGWVSYPGGPEKAISDGIILNLNELIANYAPDAKAAMEITPVIEKQSKTDSGNYYAFMAVGESNGNTQSGPIFRADWLKELNLEDPVTQEAWTNVLRAFKEQKGAEAPFTGMAKGIATHDTLPGMFGVGSGYYQDNGQVKYGPMEAGFKDYLTMLKGWYDEGLLDPDFASNDQKTVDAKVTSGKSGALIAAAGSGIGTYLTAMKDDPSFDMKAVEYPKMSDGSDPLFHHRAWEVRTVGQMAITSANKNPELTARWVNYLYTPEGGMLKNFGIEGVTYNLVNGIPQYTELVSKNPNSLSTMQVLAVYGRGDTPSPGPIIKIPGTVPRVVEAATVWNKYSENATKVLIPPITQLPDEASELAPLQTNVDSYMNEMFVRFIMGQENLDTFDAYVEQLKKLGIEKVLEHKQAALDRYLSR